MYSTTSTLYFHLHVDPRGKSPSPFSRTSSERQWPVVTYLWRKRRNVHSGTVLIQILGLSSFLINFNLITIPVAVDKNSDRLCYYVEISDNFLHTFRYNLSVLTSMFNRHRTSNLENKSITLVLALKDGTNCFSRNVGKNVTLLLA